MKFFSVLFLALTSIGGCVAPASAADVSLTIFEGRLVDLVRIAYGELSKEPYILGHEVLESQELFTVDLRNVPADRAVSSIADLVHSAGFEVRKRGGVVWIGKAQEQADELIVYRPKYRSARYLADVVQSVTAAKSVLSRSIKAVETQSGQGVQPVPVQQAQAVKQSSPTSVEGQIDRSEVDQIAFNVTPKDAAKVRKLLADLDTPSGEVVLKAAVYEVGVSKSEGSAVQLGSPLFRGFYGGIYLFHIPALAFAAGMVASGDWNVDDQLRRGLMLVAYLVGGQALYWVFCSWLGLSGPASWWVPWWLLWFLASLLTWRLLLPWVAGAGMVGLLVVSVLAVAVGFIPVDGYLLSWHRSVYFFPFFLGGHLFGREALKISGARSAWLFSLPVVASVLWVTTGGDLSLLYGSKGYIGSGIEGVGVRVLLLASSGLAVVGFVGWVSRSRLFAHSGRWSLWIYLFHGFPVLLLRI